MGADEGDDHVDGDRGQGSSSTGRRRKRTGSACDGGEVGRSSTATSQGHDSSSGDRTPKHSKRDGDEGDGADAAVVGGEVRQRRWPEDADADPSSVGCRACCCWKLRRTYRRWTYSYMDAILRKGSRQRASGDRLLQDDLFPVPAAMRADRLADLFW